MLLPVVVAAFGLVLAATSAQSAASPQQSKPAAPKSASELVKVMLTSDATLIGPGETFHLIIEFTIAPGWHIYWKNPGETGAPTEFDIEGPNYTVGEPIFARPDRIEAPDGETFGYEKRAVVLIPITAPERTGDGHVQFNIDVTYLVCKQVCLMGRPDFSYQISTSATPTGHKTSLIELGQQLDASFPQPLKELERAEAKFDGRQLSIALPVPEKEKITFFPHEFPGVTFGNASIAHRDGMVSITVPVEVKPENALGEKMRVAGLVALGKRHTDPCYEFELPVEAEEPAQADASGN